MASISILSSTSSSVTVRIIGLQNPQNTYSGFRVRASSGVYTSIPVSTSTGSATSTATIFGLSSFTYVTIEGEAMFEDTWYPVDSASTLTRPSNFSWFTPKVANGNFNLTASEWNAFTSRINQFRVWGNTSNYSFTNANSNQQFFASQYNEARNAIGSLSSSIPTIRYSGDTIYANDLNQLVSALNSIN